MRLTGPDILPWKRFEALVQVPSINLEVARRVLSSGCNILDPQTLTHASGMTYTLFLG